MIKISKEQGLIISIVILSILLIISAGSAISESFKRKKVEKSLNTIKIELQKHVDRVKELTDSSTAKIDTVKDISEKIVTKTRYVDREVQDTKEDIADVVKSLEKDITRRDFMEQQVWERR